MSNFKELKPIFLLLILLAPSMAHAGQEGMMTELGPAKCPENPALPAAATVAQMSTEEFKVLLACQTMRLGEFAVQQLSTGYLSNHIGQLRRIYLSDDYQICTDKGLTQIWKSISGAKKRACEAVLGLPSFVPDRVAEEWDYQHRFMAISEEGLRLQNRILGEAPELPASTYTIAVARGLRSGKHVLPILGGFSQAAGALRSKLDSTLTPQLQKCDQLKSKSRIVKCTADVQLEYFEKVLPKLVETYAQSIQIAVEYQLKVIANLEDQM